MSPTTEQIWTAVEHICSSNGFKQSRRLKDFLRHIVSETLEGRGSRIKSATINIEVFNRNATDDTVVRTTAVRLRDALSKYYTISEDEDVVITLPKGQYTPVFSLRSEEVPLKKTPASSDGSQSITQPWSISWKQAGILAAAFLVAVGMGLLVFNIASHGEGNEKRISKKISLFVQRNYTTSDVSKEIVENFSRELIRNLVKVGTVDIVDLGNTAVIRDTISQKIENAAYGTYLVVFYELQREEAGLKAIWRLVDARSKVVFWVGEKQSAASDKKSAGLLGAKTANSIVGIDGAINTLVDRFSGLPIESQRCMSQSRHGIIISSDSYQNKIMKCLIEVVREYPNDAVAWGLLAILYGDVSETQASWGKEYLTWRKKAKEATNQAVRLSPLSFTTQQAKLFSAFYDGALDLFKRKARRMLELYDGDPNLKLSIGSRLVRIGDYEEGKKLVIEGVTQKDTLNPWDYVSLTLAYFAEGTYEEMLAAADKGGEAHAYAIPLLKAVRLAELGRLEDARQQISELLKLRPGYQDYFYIDAKARGVSRELIDRIARGLKKAGLAISVRDAGQ